MADAKLLVLTLALVACGKTKAPPPKDLSEPAAGETFAIQLDRQACYGTCPVYTVAIDPDGTVHYDGKSYVRLRGPQTGKITPAALEALQKRFDAAKFESLDWKECGAVTDSSSANLTRVRGGRKRMTHDYHGASCVPKELRELEDEVDRVAGTKQWIDCPPHEVDLGNGQKTRVDYCDK